MPQRGLVGLAELMQSLMDGTGELNEAVARGCPTDRAVLVGRLSMWLLLAFAFEAFVHRSSLVLETDSEFDPRKKQNPGEPGVVIRLKLLREQLGLDTALPPESGEEVLRRHFRLRNRWAHDLGMLAEDYPDVPLASIICWRGPGEQAWVSDAGWSELRLAVGKLTPRILELAARRANS